MPSKTQINDILWKLVDNTVIGLCKDSVKCLRLLYEYKSIDNIKVKN